MSLTLSEEATVPSHKTMWAKTGFYLAASYVTSLRGPEGRTLAGLGSHVESTKFIAGIHRHRASRKDIRRNSSARPIVTLCSCYIIWGRLENVDGLMPVSKSRGG
jgi:hypothetical protein